MCYLRNLERITRLLSEEFEKDHGLSRISLFILHPIYQEDWSSRTHKRCGVTNLSCLRSTLKKASKVSEIQSYIFPFSNGSLINKSDKPGV